QSLRASKPLGGSPSDIRDDANVPLGFSGAASPSVFDRPTEFPQAASRISASRGRAATPAQVRAPRAFLLPLEPTAVLRFEPTAFLRFEATAVFLLLPGFGPVFCFTKPSTSSL